MNWIRPTFIYRDPRDALLLAYEYGRRVEKTGRPNAFSHLDTIEKSIDFMSDYMADWEPWMHLANPATFRHEDLLTDYHQQAERLVNFLDLDPKPQKIHNAIEKTSPETLHRKQAVILAREKSGGSMTC